jgi:2-methylcitrate dehydratase PrpD
MGAQYSIPYCVAAALIGDPRDPARFQAEAINDPVARQLARRVNIVIDPEVEAVYPAKFGARVKLTVANGTSAERTVLECHGTPADPCTGEERLAKFRLLAASRLTTDGASGLASAVDKVTRSPVRALTRFLRDNGAASRPERQIA